MAAEASYVAGSGFDGTEAGPMSFAKQTLVVAAGAGGAQLVLFLATPWLARAYSPAAFGEFAVFQSVMVALVTVSCLRYEMAIPVEKDARQVGHLSAVSLLAVLAVSAVALAVTLSVHFRMVPVGAGALGASIAYVPFVLLCTGLFQLTTFLGIREGNFLHTGLFKVGQAACFVIAALLLPGVGLVGAFAIGAAFSALGLLRYRHRLYASSRYDLINVARRYRDYPLLSMPTALLDSLALAAPVLIISEFFSSQDTGNFSQVQRLAAAPLLLVAMAISQVFFKHASEHRHAGQPLAPLLVRTVAGLAVGGLALWLAVAAFGEPLFRLLLGNAWRTDTGFLLLSITPIVIRILVSPVSNIFMVCDRVRLGTAWQVLHFAAAFGVLPLAARLLAFDDFLRIIVVNDLVIYLAYGLLALGVAKKTDTEARSPCAESRV